MYESIQEFTKFTIPRLTSDVPPPSDNDLHPQACDIEGEKFGDLEVLYHTDEREAENIVWVCLCTKCGKLTKANVNSLKQGRMKSCGCYGIPSKVGERVGKLYSVAYNPIEHNSKKCASLTAICDCGNLTEIRSSKWGKTKSCGCLVSEVNSELMTEFNENADPEIWVKEIDIDNEIDHLNKTPLEYFKEEDSLPQPLREVGCTAVDRCGDKYGRLTALYPVEGSSKDIRWLCVCSCKSFQEVSSDNLVSGNVRSCGCLSDEVRSHWGSINGQKRKINIPSGTEFGRWTVIEEAETELGERNKYVCECSCGNVKEVSTSSLRSGNSRSCGCIGGERMREMWEGVTGEDHPRWKGNRTEIEAARGLYKERGVNKKIYERDDHTCQICLNRNCELNAHHMDSFTECPDRRQDPTNLITLCKSCHKHYHDTYGWRGAREEMFVKYYLTIVFSTILYKTYKYKRHKDG